MARVMGAPLVAQVGRNDQVEAVQDSGHEERAGLQPNSTAMVRTLALAMLLLLPLGALPTRYRIVSTTGWDIVDLAGKLTPAHLSASTAGLRMDYQRGRVTLLQYAVALSGFQTITAEVRSKQPMLLICSVEERGGAKFHQTTQLAGGQWCKVVFSAPDFKLNDDSPVKKDKLDTTDMLGALHFADGAIFTGESGPNQLSVREIEIR